MIRAVHSESLFAFLSVGWFEVNAWVGGPRRVDVKTLHIELVHHREWILRELQLKSRGRIVGEKQLLRVKGNQYPDRRLERA